MIRVSSSSEETIDLGYKLGKRLVPGTVLCFHGDLAAGKTTFIKGLAKGFADYNEDLVNSPTFVYLNIYEGVRRVYHFDLYRLTKAEEFIHMGFDEYLFSDGVCCIEWSERIKSYLPEESVHVKLEHIGEGMRRVTIDA